MKRRHLVVVISAVTLLTIIFVAAVTIGVGVGTDPGREQIRALIQQQVGTRVRGKVFLGKIHGGLLTGFTIDSYEPSPGWKRTVAGSTVTWAGGRVPTEEDAVFRFNATTSGAHTYTFKVLQSYSSGEVVSWAGPESSDTPAPTVQAMSSFGGGGGRSTLSIVALALGAMGLIVGAVALASRGGRPLV